MLEPARWPILAMLARVYPRSIDGTSCQAERQISSPALTAGGLRGRLSSRKVEQLMFLRLGARLLREVKAFGSKMNEIGKRCRAGREKACATQARVAGEVIDVKDL